MKKERDSPAQQLNAWPGPGTSTEQWLSTPLYSFTSICSLSVSLLVCSLIMLLVLLFKKRKSDIIYMYVCLVILRRKRDLSLTQFRCVLWDIYFCVALDMYVCTFCRQCIRHLWYEHVSAIFELGQRMSLVSSHCYSWCLSSLLHRYILRMSFVWFCVLHHFSSPLFFLSLSRLLPNSGNSVTARVNTNRLPLQILCH